MSIQRWSVARSELCPVGEEAIEIVTYADHVAAVAVGQRDEREAIAQAFDERGLPATAAVVRAREEKP